jgi:inorganic phosphate transporter, PiT family
MDLTLILVVAIALFFDFTNGFHDTANSIATSVSTRALSPRLAVLSAAALNFIGAFFFFKVAATVATGIVNPDAITLEIVLAGLVGAITWNLITWYIGLPSSSSHALIGGIVGAAVAATGGFDVVQWAGLKEKVLIPSLLAPILGLLGAAALMTVILWVIRKHSPGIVNRIFRRLQLISGGFVAFTHGTNDAQKTMGVIAWALITTGHLTGDVKKDGLPFWIIFSCALAIGLGTYIGGWRVIRTLGKGLVEIESPQGLAAEASSAAIILSSSAAGMALSTTRVATGSILGSGVGKPGAEVRWAVAGRMAVAWLVTLPAAALMGALAFWLSHGVESLTGSDLAGDGLIFVILCALSFYIWWRAQKQKVDSNNVNADWDSSTNSVVPADVREASKEAKPTAAV